MTFHMPFYETTLFEICLGGCGPRSYLDIQLKYISAGHIELKHSIFIPWPWSTRKLRDLLLQHFNSNIDLAL